MRRSETEKRMIIIGLAFLIFLSFGLLKTTVRAADAPEKTDVAVTDLKFLNQDQSAVSQGSDSKPYYLEIGWDASRYGNTLKAGDAFTIALPDQIRFQDNAAATHFKLYAADGTTAVADAAVTPGRDGGGTVKITFTNYVESHYQVKGTIRLLGSFIPDKIQCDKNNVFKAATGQTSKEMTLCMIKTEVDAKETLSQSAACAKGDTAQWAVRLNCAKQGNKNVTLSGALNKDQNRGVHYVDRSFVLQKMACSEDGKTAQGAESVNISDKVRLSGDKTSFTCDLGDLDASPYQLTYQTGGQTDRPVKSTVKLSGEDISAQVNNVYQPASGSGTGEKNAQICLEKTDSENANVKLKGAVFQLTRQGDQQVTTLTTRADGKAAADKLTAGDYVVREIAPPKGYEINRQTATLHVKAGQTEEKVYGGKRIKRSLRVRSTCVGPRAGRVVIHLSAGGRSYASATLTERTNWEHTFEVPKYNTQNGREIKYRPIAKAPGFASQTSGSAAEGFTVKNINTAKTSVPAKVKWFGKTGDFATIRLIADGGEQRETKTVTAKEHWRTAFTGLPKYDGNDGHEIKYTVQEEPIKNYNVAIFGSEDTGYVINNTVTGRLTIPVTEICQGGSRKKIKVRLFADGKEKRRKTLCKKNRWRTTFKKLPQYAKKDGHRINYTIMASKARGHRPIITYNAVYGYSVTMVSREKITVPVKKKWVGPAAKSATVRLLADNKIIAAKTLTAKTNWCTEFRGLPKYSVIDGHRIIYTISEKPLKNYTNNISGTMSKGYTITNTMKGKTSVSVTKIDEKIERRSVKIYLMADGKVIAIRRLTRANRWQTVFAGLRARQGKSRMRYTIKAGADARYRITGNAQNGYCLTR
ncbi:Cna B-type domain-containing protein [Pseudoramibacter sp. HA2172]|uniref:Cna B-type domain-containing protein n=1 Tax=Pseudoramibacter faecis TaxID=3108534 RepID=UPI002E76CA16|nr:Cna B-type domain-containing protein [Pseudoramibacter sp. HA2172]